MTYWNPTTNPNHASNNWLNPNPQNYAAQSQNLYNQNYNALGNQLMAGTGVNTQNALLDQSYAAQQNLTNLQNQGIDLQTQNQQRSNQGALARLNNQLAGIPNEKAWRNRLKQLAEGQYNLEMQTAGQGFKEGMQNLYSGAVSRGGGLAQVGVRQSHQNLSKQLQLAQGQAKNNLQTQYANYTHYVQQLDQDARDLGIQRDTLHAGMNDALKSAGLDKTINLAQLAALRQSNDVKKADNANQVWQMLQLYAMQHPQAVAPTPAQLPSASLGHKVF